METGVALGELCEEIERAGVDPTYQIPAGMTKAAYLKSRLADALTDEDDCELNFHPKKVGLIVNRAPGGKVDEGTLEENTMVFGVCSWELSRHAETVVMISRIEK